MKHPEMIILYVGDVARSAAFYSQILEAAPRDQSPNFAMFGLNEGLALGLWQRDDVEPKVGAAAPAQNELALIRPDAASVDATCQRWRELGAVIVQDPTDMDFGHTFTAKDPDGHRLRVFSTSM